MPERLPSVEPEKRFSYEILSDPEVRESIRERMGRFLRAVHDRKVDTLVFLDRSARPLSWLFRAMWKKEYPSEAVPDVKFVNIGTATDVHAGQSGVLSGDGAQIAKHDEIQGMLFDSVKDDRWITPDDIPERWKEIVREKREWIGSLRKTFDDPFEARHVVIVDELGGSGRTQMTALGLFAEAFPAAWKFEAATFFRSDARNGGGERADKEQLPWFREEGMAGVLELPESDALLSGALTRENIEKIRNSLRAQLGELESWALVLVSRDIKILRSRDLGPRFEEPILAWEKMLACFRAGGTAAAYDKETEMSIRQSLIRVVRETGMMESDRDAWNRFRESIGLMNDGASKIIGDCERLQKALDAHFDLPSLVAKSRQLRREMEELAKGKA